MKKYFDPYHSPEVQNPPNDQWAAKREAADSVRALIEAIMTTDADRETLKETTVALNGIIDRLSALPQRKGRMAFEEPEGMALGPAGLGYELNALDGKSNPVAPPIITWIDGEKAFGRVTMGWQYEGPPRCVHGGFVAALFDQFLGCAQVVTGQPGFTGTLTTRYITPTPLNVELRLEGWVDKVEGRKATLIGEMYADDVLTARSEGIFIAVEKERFEELTQGKS